MSYDTHPTTVFHYVKWAVWKEHGHFLLCALKDFAETLCLLQLPSTPWEIMIFGLQTKGNSVCSTTFHYNHGLSNLTCLLYNNTPDTEIKKAKTEEDESAEVEDGDKQDSGEKEVEEEEEDEVPSLPLGLTGILYSLFHTWAKSQGLTLSFQSKLWFSSDLCESGVSIHDVTLAAVQLLFLEICIMYTPLGPTITSERVF